MSVHQTVLFLGDPDTSEAKKISQVCEKYNRVTAQFTKPINVGLGLDFAKSAKDPFEYFVSQGLLKPSCVNGGILSAVKSLIRGYTVTERSLLEEYKKEKGKLIREIVDDFSRRKLISFNFWGPFKLLEGTDFLAHCTCVAGFKVQILSGLHAVGDMSRVLVAQFAAELSKISRRFTVLIYSLDAGGAFFHTIYFPVDDVLLRNGEIVKASGSKSLANDLRGINKQYKRVLQIDVKKIPLNQALLQKMGPRKIGIYGKDWRFDESDMWLDDYLQLPV